MSSISPWVPVIGTLAGSVLGFASSFITTWWSSKKNSDKEEIDRKRKNLEDAYRTLVDIKTYYRGLSGKLASKVHYGIAPKIDQSDDMSPLIKGEMLIKLYLQELSDKWDDFDLVKVEFGEIYASVVTTNYDNVELRVKQDLTQRIMNTHKKIEEKIDIIQHEISTVIMP